LRSQINQTKSFVVEAIWVAVDCFFMPKIPVMKETGGYIVGLDHLVPVEFTFQKFKEYADYIKQKLIIN